jgi:hypothetical protein
LPRIVRILLFTRDFRFLSSVARIIFLSRMWFTIFMSTFGFLPGSSMIFGFRSAIIRKLSFAAALSFSFVPFLSFKFPSSFMTSCGICHSIFSSMICSAMFGKSIFCFAHVRTKFVSSNIFIDVIVGEDLYKLASCVVYERGW